MRGNWERDVFVFRFFLFSSCINESLRWWWLGSNFFFKEFWYGFLLEKLCVNDYCKYIMYKDYFKREWRENCL